MTRLPGRGNAAALIAIVATAGCAATTYEARRAPLGDPPSPVARAAGVDEWQFSLPPGTVPDSKSTMSAPIVTSDGLRLESRDLHSETSVVWDVRLQGGEDGVEVRQMTWSEPSAPRCQGGNLARDFLLDPEGDAADWLPEPRQVHWERPLIVRGERVVSGRFDRDAALLGRPADEICVRVPVTGPDVEYEMRKRWSLGLRFGARDELPFSDGRALLGGLSLGRWVGPVRLGLEGIIGGARDRGDSLTVFGFAAETSGAFAVVSPHWRLGWSAAFEALWARDEAKSVHGSLPPIYGSAGGLRVGVQLLATQQAPERLWRFSPTSACGFELFAAVEPEWTGQVHGSRVDFGLAALVF